MTIKNGIEMDEVLQKLRNREPFFFELVGENGYQLLVGLGKVGCAQYSRDDGSGLFQVAIAPSAQNIEGYVEFLAGDTPTPISKRYCMPWQQVKQIVFYFLEMGACTPEFSWKVI
jgi:hypothetical protein